MMTYDGGAASCSSLLPSGLPGQEISYGSMSSARANFSIVPRRTRTRAPLSMARIVVVATPDSALRRFGLHSLRKRTCLSVGFTATSNPVSLSSATERSRTVAVATVYLPFNQRTSSHSSIPHSSTKRYEVLDTRTTQCYTNATE